MKVDKFETQLVRIIFNRRNIIKDFLQAVGDKPVVGILLHLDQVRDVKDFLLPLVGHSNRTPGLHRTNSVFLHSTFTPYNNYIYCDVTGCACPSNESILFSRGPSGECLPVRFSRQEIASKKEHSMDTAPQ